MRTNLSAYRGCLLGLAVGDALGVTVDEKTYDEICQTYGPAGLLGYDLVNGFAEISSYTQVAAFACNGLVLCTHKGQTDYLQYCVQALKEWAYSVHMPRDPRHRSCWLSRVSQLRQRKCMDARTLDALTRDVTGTPQRPANQAVGPGTLTAAVPMGLFFEPEHMEFGQIGELGAQIVALTHGDPLAFLSGAVLAYAIAAILQDPHADLKNHFAESAAAVQAQFGGQFPQAAQLQQQIRKALELAEKPEIPRYQAMEQLGCDTAAQVLCGAMYAVLAGGADFDSVLITGVNHSGKSAAVGAIAGAITGAYAGEEALPEFYLECLQCAPVLCEVATDLHNCSVKQWRNRLFDHDWDRKYTQGLPVDRDGWAQE